MPHDVCRYREANRWRVRERSGPLVKLCGLLFDDAGFQLRVQGNTFASRFCKSFIGTCEWTTIYAHPRCFLAFEIPELIQNTDSLPQDTRCICVGLVEAFVCILLSPKGQPLGLRGHGVRNITVDALETGR